MFLCKRFKNGPLLQTCENDIKDRAFYKAKKCEMFFRSSKQTITITWPLYILGEGIIKWKHCLKC